MAEPIRTCLGCRSRRPRRELVRLVVDRGVVAVDARRDRPGRGAWVCPDEACAERALRDGGRRLRRALRADGARVTLDSSALRAAVAPSGDHDLTPPDPDASRGVPT